MPLHFFFLLVAFLCHLLVSLGCTGVWGESGAALEVEVAAWRAPSGALRVELVVDAPVQPLARSVALQPTVSVQGAELSGRWHGRVGQPGWRFVGAFPVEAREVWVSWPANALTSVGGGSAPEELGRWVTVEESVREDPPLLGWSDLPPLEHGCGCHSEREGPPPRLDRASLLSTGPARRPTARWIEPGEPTESWLLFSLVAEHPLRRGPQMPPPWADGPEPDVDALLRALEAWVVAGARP